MTTVTLATGELYPIPTGQPGTWPWAREASLVSVAYQHAGNFAAALQWRKEYERRAAAYNAIEAGADIEAIVSAGSWLDGPASIIAYVTKVPKAIIDAADQLIRDAGKAPGKVLDWTPWILAGALGVIAVWVYRGGLRVRV